MRSLLLTPATAIAAVIASIALVVGPISAHAATPTSRYENLAVLTTPDNLVAITFTGAADNPAYVQHADDFVADFTQKYELMSNPGFQPATQPDSELVAAIPISGDEAIGIWGIQTEGYWRALRLAVECQEAGMDVVWPQ